MRTDTVQFTRLPKGLRTAELPLDGEVKLGIPDWVAELHRSSFPTPDSYERHTGTFEYLVVAVAGCLLDHYGIAVELRRLPATDDALTSSAWGEVVAEDDGCLMINAIHVTYRLAVPADRELGARDLAHLERALTTHSRRCPIARTLRGRTAIVASLELSHGDGPARTMGPAVSNVAVETASPVAG